MPNAKATHHGQPTRPASTHRRVLGRHCRSNRRRHTWDNNMPPRPSCQAIPANGARLNHARTNVRLCGNGLKRLSQPCSRRASSRSSARISQSSRAPADAGGSSSFQKTWYYYQFFPNVLTNRSTWRILAIGGRGRSMHSASCQKGAFLQETSHSAVYCGSRVIAPPKAGRASVTAHGRPNTSLCDRRQNHGFPGTQKPLAKPRNMWNTLWEYYQMRSHAMGTSKKEPDAEVAAAMP